jgi:serine/threonine protein kinase
MDESFIPYKFSPLAGPSAGDGDPGEKYYDRRVTPAFWRQLEELYQAALELPAAERNALLERADPQLRAKVEAMLAQSGSALDRPAWERAAMLDATKTILTAGAQFGPYRIEHSIGAGGMGQVFRATDTRLDRPVAIKISNRAFNDRFEREARAIARLNHPHICTLHDVGPNYLVMELVDGETLAKRLKQGPLPKDQMFETGAQAADALAAAHAKGIVHRDLKPANIMLTPHGVKVLDFGLAKIADGNDSLTGTGTVMGTLAYMAPEQVRGLPVDAKADLFALGLILYETSTGKLPFPGASLGNMLQTGEAVPLAPPSRVRPGLPAKFDRLVSQLLAADPAQRPAGAAEVRDQLREAASQKSVSRRTLVTTGLAAATLAPAAAGIWWLARRGAQPQLQVASLKQIGPLNGNKEDPALSPDGSSLAFSWAGEKGDSPGIYVMSVAVMSSGGEPRRLTQSSNSDISPVWAPDGQRIAFLRLHPGTAIELIIVPAGGGPEQKVRDVRIPELLRRGQRPLAAWNHAENAIVVPMEDPGAGTASLYRVALDGSPARRLVPALGDVGFTEPAVSSDGRWLTYLGSGGFKIVRLAEDDTPTGETPGAQGGQSPALSPDGRRLLFLRESQIMAWDADKNAASVVYVSPYGMQAMTASWDAHNLPQVVFSIIGGQGELRSMEIQDGGRKASPATASILPAALAASFSPDGRWIVFDRPASRGQEVWMADVRGEHQRQLTSLGGDASRARWSPDGKRIAFHGATELYVLDLDPAAEASKPESSTPQGVPRQITHDGVRLFGPDWSAEGKYLYATHPGGIYRVMRAPVAGGDLEDLFEGDFVRVDPAGKRIYYGKSGKSGIYARSLDGDIRSNKEDRVVSDYVPPRGFDVNANGIFYLGRDAAGKPAAIRFFEFASGKSFDLAPPPLGIVPSIAISPDGRLLLYDTRSDAAGSLNLMQLRVV